MAAIERVGRYELLEPLAVGGMGTILLARAVEGQRRLVVVKRPHPHLLADRVFSAMFREEAHIASSVHHPNVVRTLEVIETRDGPNLIMDYVESLRVSQVLDAAVSAAARIPVPIVGRIVADALEGLHAVHEAVDEAGHPLGIVHRDANLTNIIVGADGTSRLLDFGVAKATRRLVETGKLALKGKIAYMAPEQIRGDAVDRRADLFAMGVVLHEILSQRPLFRALGDADTLRKVMGAPVHPPSVGREDVAAPLDAVTLRALSRAAGDRYATARAFHEDLAAATPLASAQEVSAFLALACAAPLEAHRAVVRRAAARR